MARRDTKIDTKAARDKLPPRREPYWQKVRGSRYLGFRAGAGTWIARQMVGERHLYSSLGERADWDAAIEEADKWWAKADEGESDPGYTVENAIADYLEHQKAEKGERAWRDAGYKLNLVDKEMRKVKLVDFKAGDLIKWRDGLAKGSRASKDTANRNLSAFKAALNHAWRSGHIKSDNAWRRVRGFKAVGASRRLYLTEKQVAALLKAAKKADEHLHDLVEVAVVTGARYSELTGVTVGDFNPKAGTLQVSGKTGGRTMILSSAAIDTFKRLAKGKLPGAYLLTKADGEPWGKSHQQRPFRELVKAAKLPASTVFYSLRHYYASRALLAGVHIPALAKNMGTSIKMIEATYGKFRDHDVRAMLDEVAL